MKYIFGILIAGLMIGSCKLKSNMEAPAPATTVPMVGTWKLISGTIIEKGDTVTTLYQGNSSFIKIINDAHFAFLKHNINVPKDSANGFDAGGGTYTIHDSTYTEHLEYCLEKEWEGHDFTFTVSILNDTLIQKGVEKIENTNINRLNIEKYFRLKNK